MARTVARAIQDLLGSDTERPVKIRLFSGAPLLGRLDDLQQFDEVVVLIEPNGRQTVIPLAAIVAVELAEPLLPPSSPREVTASGAQPTVAIGS